MKELELFEVKNKYKLPEKHKGKHTKNGGLTINDPRKWTDEEIDWLTMLQKKNFTIKQIAKCLDRDVVSTSIKIKRLKKKDGRTYNEKHRKEKYAANDIFLQKIKPVSVLDLYSGEKSYYEGKVDAVQANDINEKYNVDSNWDSLRLLCKAYSEEYRYDLIDLDPFGSAYDCFDLAIKIARKGLIITFGEYGHKRWKRLDYVGERYNIEKLEDFNVEKLMQKVVYIGIRNKKTLLPIIVKQWTNICRVYFKIEK